MEEGKLKTVQQTWQEGEPEKLSAPKQPLSSVVMPDECGDSLWEEVLQQPAQGNASHNN